MPTEMTFDLHWLWLHQLACLGTCPAPDKIQEEVVKTNCSMPAPGRHGLAKASMPVRWPGKTVNTGLSTAGRDLNTSSNSQAQSSAAYKLHCPCCMDLSTSQHCPSALQNAGNMDKSSTALLGGISKGRGAPSGSSPLGPKPGQNKSAAGRPDADDEPAPGGIAAFGGPAEASGSREVHFGFKCMPEFLKLMLACWV